MAVPLYGRCRNCDLKNFSQDPLEDEERKQWHKTVGQDQDSDRIHTFADGVLEMDHKIGDAVNGSLEEVGQLFENGLILRAALHGFIELVGAALCLFYRFIDICRKVGGDDVGNVCAARYNKRHRQAKDTNPDCQAFQKVLFCCDRQQPRAAGQGDKYPERYAYSVLDQDFFQKQGDQNNHKVEIHVRQAVRQRRGEVVWQRGDGQRGGQGRRREFRHSAAAFFHTLYGVLDKF